MPLTRILFLISFFLTTELLAQRAVPGEFIVRFKSSQHAKKFYASRGNRSLGKHRMVTKRIAPIGLLKAENMRSTYSALKGDPNIAYIEPNYIYNVPAGRSRYDRYVSRSPNDPSFKHLWGLNNTGQLKGKPGVDINALKAWKLSRGNKALKIAVIDTGIDYNHPDLKDNIWRNPGEIPGNGIDDDGNGYIDDVVGYDFINDDPDPMDDNSHGTHCAGTIGAKHNRIGVAGVMNDVQMMALKFISAKKGGTLEAALQAIEYATMMGAHVMSNSWGGGGYSKALYEAIKKASERGIIFVAAAGNDNSDNDKRPTYPASYDLPNVISVAAIEATGMKSSFSNYGVNSVHVAAPGTTIMSTLPGGKYGSLSGTSMAAPHVSGVVGLILSTSGKRSIKSMRSRLIFSSTKSDDLQTVSNSLGYVDAYAAMRGVKSVRD